MTRPLIQKTPWRQDIAAGVLAYFTAAPAILICFYLLDPIIHNQFPTLSLLCLWAGLTTLIGSRWIGVPLVMIPNISVISILVFSLYWGEAWSSRHIILILILVSTLLIIMGFLGVGKILESHLPSFYPAALLAGLGFLLVTTGLRLGGFIVSHPVTFSFLGEMTTRSTLIVITGLSLYLVAWSRSYFSPPLWGFSGALIISLLLDTFQFTLDATPIWSPDYSLSLPFTDIKSLDLWHSLPGICFIVLLETMIIGLALRYVYPQSHCLDRIFKMCGIGGGVFGDDRGSRPVACSGRFRGYYISEQFLAIGYHNRQFIYSEFGFYSNDIIAGEQHIGRPGGQGLSDRRHDGNHARNWLSDGFEKY